MRNITFGNSEIILNIIWHVPAKSSSATRIFGSLIFDQGEEIIRDKRSA